MKSVVIKIPKIIKARQIHPHAPVFHRLKNIYTNSIKNTPAVKIRYYTRKPKSNKSNEKTKQRKVLFMSFSIVIINK